MRGDGVLARLPPHAPRARVLLPRAAAPAARRVLVRAPPPLRRLGGVQSGASALRSVATCPFVLRPLIVIINFRRVSPTRTATDVPATRATGSPTTASPARAQVAPLPRDAHPRPACPPSLTRACRRPGAAAAGVQQPARAARRGAAVAVVARAGVVAQEHRGAGLVRLARSGAAVLDRRAGRQHLPRHAHGRRCVLEAKCSYFSWETLPTL